MKFGYLTISLLMSFSLLALSPGDTAPNFTLKNQNGKDISLSQFKGKTIVLEWYNEGCPYVRKHYDKPIQNMPSIQSSVKNDVVWLTLSSSAKGKQGYVENSNEAKKLMKKEEMKSHHLLLDSDGKVGRLYSAKTTPHMYIIGKNGKLVYVGAIDSIRGTDTSEIKKATNYVKDAINSIQSGRKIAVSKTKSYGCSVKY